MREVVLVTVAVVGTRAVHVWEEEQNVPPLHVNENRCAGVAELSDQRNQAGRQGRQVGRKRRKRPRRWKRRHGTQSHDDDQLFGGLKMSLWARNPCARRRSGLGSSGLARGGNTHGVSCHVLFFFGVFRYS